MLGMAEHSKQCLVSPANVSFAIVNSSNLTAIIFESVFLIFYEYFYAQNINDKINFLGDIFIV